MALPVKFLIGIKTFRILFLLAPFIIAPLLFLYFNEPPLILLSDSKNNMVLFNDSVNKGNSGINLVSSDKESIIFRYTLGDGYQFAYAGLKIKSPGLSYFNLSSYDYLKIRIKAAKGLRLPVVLGTKTEHATADDLSLRSSEYIIDVSKEPKEMKVYLKQFRTPDWWLNLNKKKELEMEPPDFSKVKFINIQSCVLLGKNKEDIVKIDELSFHKDLSLFYLFSLVLSSAWYIIGGFVLFRKTPPPAETNVIFNYEKTEAVNHYENEEKTIFTFLTSHYDRQDLTIIEVQNETGISETKISNIIKNETKLSFKQFLNKLRITESKRLLSETDLQVSEIAYKVGYANISHFNRVFKEEEACTPNDFRKRSYSKQ
jgi:AraC-like DNA-binding protein